MKCRFTLFIDQTFIVISDNGLEKGHLGFEDVPVNVTDALRAREYSRTENTYL